MEGRGYRVNIENKVEALKLSHFVFTVNLL